MTSDDTLKTTANVTTRTAETRIPRRTFVPSADAYETGDAYVIETDLPGAEEKDIDVTTENGVLTIKAVSDATVREGMTLLREEIPARRWFRSFDLGEGIDVAGIRGKFSRGVLRLTLPKHETTKARRIAISG